MRLASLIKNQTESSCTPVSVLICNKDNLLSFSIFSGLTPAKASLSTRVHRAMNILFQSSQPANIFVAGQVVSFHLSHDQNTAQVIGVRFVTELGNTVSTQNFSVPAKQAVAANFTLTPGYYEGTAQGTGANASATTTAILAVVRPAARQRGQRQKSFRRHDPFPAEHEHQRTAVARSRGRPARARRNKSGSRLSLRAAAPTTTVPTRRTWRRWQR